MSTAFSGYALPTSSTTYTPNQFFDVVLPNASRGCLRLVGYLIRKTLGWSDEHGNPRNPEAHVSYRELIEDAGISRGAIKDAIQEALDKRFIQCLRFGQPHRPNEEGFPALYCLKWDETEKYVTEPDDFQGFFAGNGNLTHIPNQFFDYTIPREPLAVVQVIGVIIRTSIGWQSKFGFRRMQTELSFSEIMRRTGINSRTTISNAIKAAVDGNHIRRVEHGVFDPNAGVTSKASVYAIRWNDEESPGPVEKPVVLEDTQPTLFDSLEDNGSKSGPATQFKICTGKPTVQKVDRSSTVQKVDREHDSETGPDDGSKSGPASVQELDCPEFKNRTDIETTNLNNTPKQQQQTERGDVVVGDGLSLALLIGKLMAEGIEAVTAARLVENFPSERVVRQLDALPSRKIKSSRTGFLIRAIELDIPVENLSTVKVSPDRAFASHFYAELGGNSGEPVAHVNGTDEEAAGLLLGQFPKGLASDCKQLGRSFGKYVAKRQEGSKFPVRTLSLAVRNFGDEFFATRRDKFEAEMRERVRAKREAHQKQFEPAYQGHLARVAREHLAKDPAFAEAFQNWSLDKLARRKRLSEKFHRAMEEQLATEEGRLAFAIEYLSESKPELLPAFWDWDAKLNPEKFSTDGEQA